MPIYYDFTKTARERRLHPWHMSVACEYLGYLRGRVYGDRAHGIDADELAL